ncbi:MAG TPA: hypothetical protein VLQ93_24795 [Myxococcaceae bacterium]|nr:hypothetical protein [Myxococcaceae bacterium]
MASMDINPQQMQEKARQLQENVVPQLEEARRNLEDLNQRVTDFIRANPGTCLLGAVAVGFIVGRIASRR